MEPRALLLRRVSLWILFALALLESLVLVFYSEKLDYFFGHALGGRPLPILTTWLFAVGKGYFLLPVVAFGVALFFSVRKEPSQDVALFIAVAFGSILLGLPLVFAVGLLAPAVSLFQIPL